MTSILMRFACFYDPILVFLLLSTVTYLLFKRIVYPPLSADYRRNTGGTSWFNILPTMHGNVSTIGLVYHVCSRLS